MPPLQALPTRPTLSTTSASLVWREFRGSLPWAQAILYDHHQIHPLRRASNAAIVKHGPDSPFANEPNVYPESLRQTLDAHREANRASLIHKVSESGEKQPLVLGSFVPEIPQKVPKKRFETAIHLKFTRLEAKARRDWRVGRRGKVFDYSGECRGLIAPWSNRERAPSHECLPWLRELSAASRSPSEEQCLASERLTSEILAFHDYILPQPDELAAADRATTALRSCVKSIDPSAKMNLVGSRQTGLATALSDLDFNITHPNGGNSTGLPHDQEQAHELLDLLWMKLRKRGSPVRASHFLRGARVPIITGSHVATNLSFQIQCTGDAFNSMRYAQDCVAEYPTLRPLYMVLRQMLEIRGLNVGSMGGLGSYPLLIMLVAALKFSETKMGRREAGKQLCFFLDMYSKIDFYTTAISLVPLEYVFKAAPQRIRLSQQSGPMSTDRESQPSAMNELSEEELEGRRWFSKARAEPHMMCLQDPSNLGHDLGKQVRLIKHIQAVFIEADRSLREAVNDWDTSDWTQQQGTKSRIALLDWCIGADYELFEDERMALSLVRPVHGRAERNQGTNADIRSIAEDIQTSVI